MKTKENNILSISELRERTVVELEETILNAKKELFNKRMEKATQKLENTASIRALKKEIAQAKTVITEKEGK